MATTEEQMMIMGLCLQGILANPSRTSTMIVDVASYAMRERTPAEVEEQINANVKLAHQYAAKLMPQPPLDDAARLSKMTHQAYELLRTGKVEGAGAWGEFHHVRLGGTEDQEDDLNGVFERVTRFYYSPGHPPESIQDWIICTVVALGRPAEGEDHGA